MSRTTHNLRLRQEVLQRRAEYQRLQWRSHWREVDEVVDSVDRGLGMLQRVATPPVLVGAAVVGALLLGAGRARRTLASGLAIAGLLLKVRSVRDLFARWVDYQPVRRSR